MKDKEFELYLENQTRDITIYCKKAGYDLFEELVVQEAKREGFIITDPNFIQPLNPPVELEAVLYYNVEEHIELFKDYLTEEVINTLRNSGEPIKVEFKHV